MPTRITLMSWNAQRPGKGRIRGVLDAILERNPDVLTLQEANDTLVERLEREGYEHTVYGRRDAPNGLREGKPKHGALIASRFPLKAKLRWTKRACWPSLFVRAEIDLGEKSLDVWTAHIPNGSGNGWPKVHHCKVLSQAIREAKPGSRILTGDFNEPRAFLDDGRVVPFGGRLRDGVIDHLDKPAKKGVSEELLGPFTWGEWDRGVGDLFNPGYTGLTHALKLSRKSKSMRPMPVTHVTRANRRFFDHAFVSADLRPKLTYLHDLRKDGVSDHSALLLQLKWGEVKETPKWDEDSE